MDKFFLKVVALIFTTLTLVACSAELTPAATRIPPAVELSTSLPQPTLTAYPPPTERPTLTPTAAMPTVEIPILPSLTSNPADADLSTLQAPFRACDSWSDKRLSPQENMYVCGGGNDFTVMRRDGDPWHFSAQEQFGTEYYGDFMLMHWTADEQYLYFALMNPMDGVGPMTANADVLFRMDLSDGKVTTTLGDLNIDDPGRDFYVVSISPTSRRLAYSGGYVYRDVRPQTKLHLVDLKTGQEKIIPMDLEYSHIGKFVWSDDGLHLVYKLYYARDEADDYCKYSCNYSGMKL